MLTILIIISIFSSFSGGFALGNKHGKKVSASKEGESLKKSVLSLWKTLELKLKKSDHVK